MGKTPCRPFSGLRVSCGGVLVTPGLGERALDQAQDDLMGKKCPQEEYQALTAKTTVLITASSSLSPCCDKGGGSGLAGPLSRTPTQRVGPWSTSPAFSESRCLRVSLSLSLSLYLYL